MKKLLALGLMAMLLFGCASAPSKTETNNTGTAPGNATGTQNQTAGGQNATARGNQSVIPAPTQDTTHVLTADTVFPGPPVYDFSNITTADGRLIVYYFHSKKCGACAALQPEIDSLEAKYPDLLWLDYDITTANGSSAYLAFADQHNLSAAQRLVPQVLVNGTIITDRFSINKTLEGMITNFKPAAQ